MTSAIPGRHSHLFLQTSTTFQPIFQSIDDMAPVKKDKEEMSAFERSRLANIATNSAIVKDLSSAAAKIAPKIVGRPKSTAPRKRATPVKREEPRPTRTSSRLAGIEADSETQKRKAEVEYEFATEQAKAKKLRVSGDLKFSDIVVDGKKWSKDDGFLTGIMRGAQPNVRTFTEDDVKETTDEGLKALREKMSEMELYEGYEPNRWLSIVQIMGVYSTNFHRNQNNSRTCLLTWIPSFTRQTSYICWRQIGQHGYLRCLSNRRRRQS